MDTPKEKTLQDWAEEMTMDEFGEFFKSIQNRNNGMFCSACGSNEWDLHSNPDDRTKPAIITLPLPDKDGYGMWCFYLMCKNCGGIKLFSASKAAEFKKKKDQS